MGLSNTLLGVIIIHMIFALPYSIYIISDMFKSIGNKLENQAVLFGASRSKAFFLITLPLLIPAIITSMSISYIISSSQYFITLIIGGGRVKTLSLMMVPFVQKGDRLLASVYAMLIIVSSLVVFLFFQILLKTVVKKIIRS